ncbi:MAG: mannonate dehydratase [Candidatus Latescibacterota bacterium]|nr:mannonate dehydratase [Candidatus Latescibacterota bacterium]
MIKIAVCLPPVPSLGWTLMRQCGVEYAVCHDGLEPIAGVPDNDQPWTEKSLAKKKKIYEDEIGVELAVWEGRPAMDKIKLNLPGRDEQIDITCQMLLNMGKLGIPVWCSMWMPILGVMRTERERSSRGSATVSAFRHTDLDDSPTEHGIISEEEQWDNLHYFLERVVPIAEEAGVKMAMHPDDPPLSPIKGVARIMSSIDNYQRMIDMVPSPMNGIALCQGNFGLMTDDLSGAIRQFGEQGKIHFVHFRDIVGEPADFQEAFHDDGQHDPVECLRAYRDVGYDGVLRPDHYPKMGDADFEDEHGMARLYAVGYLKGIRQSVYSEKAA